MSMSICATVHVPDRARPEGKCQTLQDEQLSQNESQQEQLQLREADSA